MLHRHIDVGQRLRLHALRRVHHQHGALARGQRTGNLVGEIHMAGGVDQVERIRLPVFRRIVHGNRFAFDGDAPLPFQFHGIENLVHHVALRVHAGFFQNPVGQRRLAVIDMRDDAEIANPAFRVFHACFLT